MHRRKDMRLGQGIRREDMIGLEAHQPDLLLKEGHQVRIVDQELLLNISHTTHPENNLAPSPLHLIPPMGKENTAKREGAFLIGYQAV